MSNLSTILIFLPANKLVMMVLLPKQIPISTDFSKHLLPLMANNINACIIISIIHPLQPSLLFQRHLVVFEILDCIGFVGNSWHCIKLWEHIRYTEFNNWILNLNNEQMTNGRVICFRRGTLRAFSFRIFSSFVSSKSGYTFLKIRK